MYGYTIQDWITIRGDKTVQYINQAESDWLGFSAFEDIVFWLDVRELTLPGTGGTGSITLNYQTAPAKDDVLFTNMSATPPVLTIVPTLPTITKVLLATAQCPLARWVRWQLQTSVTGGQTWDITFRILAAANAISMPGQ